MRIKLNLILYLSVTVLFFSQNSQAQIKIGTNGNNIEPSSILELESITQGLLLPRMANTTAIDALRPPEGMLIYITTQPAGLYVRKATGWEYLTGSLGGDGNFNSITVNGNVTAGGFSGPLNGNATSATSATNAVNSQNSEIIDDLATARPTYPTFVTATGGLAQMRTATTKLSFIPNTGILTATGFNGALVGDVTGTATRALDAVNASNTDITDELASGTIHYPTFVMGTTGNLAQKTASSRLSFIPLTGELRATTFRGDLMGNAATSNIAVALQTGRTISVTGDIAYTSEAFNGTNNVTGTAVLTNVNTSIGTFGTSTSIPTFTVNGKGLITGVTTNAVIAPAGTLTGTSLAGNVVSSSLTSVGTLTNLTVTNPIVGSIAGNAATVSTIPALTGEVSSAGNSVTLSNSAVIGKVLTGYVQGSGPVLATDNISQAIGKLEANANLKAPINNPNFTGTVTMGTPFMLGATNVTTTGAQINNLNTSTGVIGTGRVVLSDSPVFTGTPNLPTGTIGFTQLAGNNSTAVATTAFVANAISSKANTASPIFTGTPTAPTANPGDQSTQIATTKFVFDNRGMLKFTNVDESPTVPIPAGGSNEVFYAVPGAIMSGTVVVSPTGALPANLEITSARVSSNGTVAVKYRNYNPLLGASLLPSENLNITVFQ